MALKRVMVASGNNNRCTPAGFLGVVGDFAAPAGIGLDPCSNPNSIVPARVAWSLENGDDGLASSWVGHGFAYVNCPYGRQLRRWTNKICGEGGAGVEILTLTPSRTGSAWCQKLLTHSTAHCFLKKRLVFLGCKHPAPFDSLVAYFGSQTRRFHSKFRSLGLVYMHRTRPLTQWVCEIQVVLGDGQATWQRSTPLPEKRARRELDGWRARGIPARLVEAA